MKRAEYGFTMLEIMVAVSISMLIAGVALYTFNRLETYRRIQDRRIRYAEQAEAFFSILERELDCLYIYGGECEPWVLDKDYEDVHEGGNDATRFKDALTFTAAVDGPYGADHAKIIYHVSDKGLHRVLVAPGDAHVPQDTDPVFAPDVHSFEVQASLDTIPDTPFPTELLVVIKLPDPIDPEKKVFPPPIPLGEYVFRVAWSHYIKVKANAP